MTGAGTDTYAYAGASQTAYEVANAGWSGATTDSAVDAAGRYGLRAGASAAAWCLFDLHGSAAALESGARSVTDAWRYDGWGRAVASTGSTADPWRYRGALDLSPTSSPLYAMGARYYAPSAGAFTQLDSSAGSARDPLGMITHRPYTGG